jgi:hypothetical protein
MQFLLNIQDGNGHAASDSKYFSGRSRCLSDVPLFRTSTLDYVAFETPQLQSVAARHRLESISEFLARKVFFRKFRRYGRRVIRMSAGAKD